MSIRYNRCTISSYCLIDALTTRFSAARFPIHWDDIRMECLGKVGGGGRILCRWYHIYLGYGNRIKNLSLWSHSEWMLSEYHHVTCARNNSTSGYPVQWRVEEMPNNVVRVWFTLRNWLGIRQWIGPQDGGRMTYGVSYKESHRGEKTLKSRIAKCVQLGCQVISLDFSCSLTFGLRRLRQNPNFDLMASRTKRTTRLDPHSV